MISNLLNHSVVQALIATLFTYFVTLLGAALVFFFKSVNRKILDTMLGFSAGVMIAASFWSLLSPAIALCETQGQNVFIIPSIGFFLGGIFVVIASVLLENNLTAKQAKNSKGGIKRSFLLITAITLHNIPEGLAVGVAFATAYMNMEGATLSSAILLTVGIGLQNFPEGAAVSLPLRREGFSRRRAFFYGQISGFVEPIAGIFGALMAITIQSLLPWMLSFSAGAMIGVIASELLPEAVKEHKNIATVGTILGFMVMMVLDVALG